LEEQGSERTLELGVGTAVKSQGREGGRRKTLPVWSQRGYGDTRDRF